MQQRSDTQSSVTAPSDGAGVLADVLDRAAGYCHAAGNTSLANELIDATAAVAELIAAHRQLLQAYEITSDNFEEVEVDGEMVDPLSVSERSRAALAAVGAK